MSMTVDEINRTLLEQKTNQELYESCYIGIPDERYKNLWVSFYENLHTWNKDESLEVIEELIKLMDKLEKEEEIENMRMLYR